MRFKRRIREPHERPHNAKRVDIRTTVEPHFGGWRWEAGYLFNGMPNVGAYLGGGTRHHPRPYCVQGFTKIQAEAHAELSEATDLMRQRIVAMKAEHDHREARRLVEVINP